MRPFSFFNIKEPLNDSTLRTPILAITFGWGKETNTNWLIYLFLSISYVPGINLTLESLESGERDTQEKKAYRRV